MGTAPCWVAVPSLVPRHSHPSITPRRVPRQTSTKLRTTGCHALLGTSPKMGTKLGTTPRSFQYRGGFVSYSCVTEFVCSASVITVPKPCWIRLPSSAARWVWRLCLRRSQRGPASRHLSFSHRSSSDVRRPSDVPASLCQSTSFDVPQTVLQTPPRRYILQFRYRSPGHRAEPEETTRTVA